MHLRFSAVAFSFAMLAVGCKPRTFNADGSQTMTSHVAGEATGTRKHLLITPTGKTIFANALRWFTAQGESLAMPAQCAANVSEVLVNANASYGCMMSVLIPTMRNNIEAHGGKVIYLPPQDKAGIIRTLNENFPQGRIPTGTLVAGCYSGPDCAGQAGDGHISIVGDMDSRGAVQLYHNNWWRPENNGGVWVPGMVSKEMLAAGHKRQWMPTAWFNFRFNQSGLVDIQSATPDIDDLDPLTGTAGHPDGRVTVMLMLLPDMVAELSAKNYEVDVVSKDSSGNSTPSGTGCTINDSSGYTNLRQTVDLASPVTAVMASGETLSIAQRGSSRHSITKVGFMHKSVTSCANTRCIGTVIAQDSAPAVLAGLKGPYFRRSSDSSTNPIGILVNGTAVKVLEEQSSGWLKVEYSGSVSASYCR